MRWEFTEMDILKWKIRLRENPSFKKAFNKDITKPFFEDLDNRNNSKKTNHFIISIRGDTGKFKTSIGLELGLRYDKTFNIEKIGFTNDELLDIMKKIAIITEINKEIPQIFLRDETPDNLRHRADLEFSIIAETLRDSRISLILIKPEDLEIVTAHYILEPLMNTEDLKIVKVAVLEPKTNMYMGYCLIEIHLNNSLWNDYMVLKKDFQKKVIERKVNVFDSKKLSEDFLNKNNLENFIKTSKNGSQQLNIKEIKLELFREFPQLTNLERDLILQDINKKSKI